MCEFRRTGRRRLLASCGGVVGAALAGCVGARRDAGTDDAGRDGDDKDGSGNESADAGDEAADGEAESETGADDRPDVPDDAYAAASISDVRDEDVPPLSLDVELLEAGITSETPATLRVEVRNETDVTVTVGDPRSIGFDRARAAADGDALLLMNPPRAVDGDAADCWRLSEVDAPMARTTEFRSAPIEPGASLEYTLEAWWDDARSDGGCFPTGTFAFGTGVTYEASDDRYDGGGSAGWGFDLTVEPRESETPD